MPIMIDGILRVARSCSAMTSAASPARCQIPSVLGDAAVEMAGINAAVMTTDRHIPFPSFFYLPFGEFYRDRSVRFLSFPPCFSVFPFSGPLAGRLCRLHDS